MPYEHWKLNVIGRDPPIDGEVDKWHVFHVCGSHKTTKGVSYPDPASIVTDDPLLN